MTAYFDRANKEIGECRALKLTREEYMEALESVEARVIRDVSLATGDREFPADLREAIQGLIACHQIALIPGCPPTSARQCVEELGEDPLLIELLHSKFHELAGRRIRTRFGILTNDPADIVHRRDIHDLGDG